MNFETFFELIGFAGSLIAIRYYFQGRIWSGMPAVRVSLGILLAVSMVKYMVNGLEWSGLLIPLIDMDPIEDYLDDIWPVLWFFLFFSVLMDISAKETRESRRRYQTIFDGSLDAIFISDMNANILDCNQSAAQLTGYEHTRLLQMSLQDLIGTNDYRHVQAQCSESSDNDSSIMETVIRQKNGNRLAVELSNRIVLISGQQSMQTVVRDMTDKINARHILESEKERLDTTLHSIGHGVITTDTQGKITLLNKEAEELTGWTQGNARGRTFTDVFQMVDEFTGNLVDDPIDRVLTEKGSINLPNHILLVSIKGASCPVSGSATLIRDHQEEEIGVVIVFRNCAADRRLQGELMKAEKLEALGVLAGGIAHDFNNYLAGMLGHLSLMTSDARLPADLHQKMETVKKIIISARELTQQILTFSKGGSPQKELVNLSDLVKDYSSFALRGASVRCDYDLASDLKRVDIDKSQIGQVISNLVINALQAMPDGGVIVIRAENRDLETGNDLELTPGPYVKVTIKDSGAGIAPKHLGKIFDPYFTTKASGSGLGLAVAFSVITKHDGKITAESEPGIGSVFSIYLPSTDKKPQESLSVSETDALSGNRTILIMDDEHYIRDVISQMLAQMGYSVKAVADGSHAIEAYQQSMQNDSPFDVVILDLTVPGKMGGRETIRKLLEIDKNVNAIVASGYSSDSVMSDYRRYGFNAALKKPFTFHELSAAVNQTLRKASSAMPPALKLDKYS